MKCSECGTKMDLVTDEEDGETAYCYSCPNCNNSKFSEILDDIGWLYQTEQNRRDSIKE